MFVAFAVVGGTTISTVLKIVFDRPRPDLAAAARVFTASFPSGHATVSAVVYLTLGAMLAEANVGFLFHAPETIKRQFPQFKAVETYGDLLDLIKAAL